MKYVDKEGTPISGFYDLNEEMRKERKQKICMNPNCINLKVLEGLKPNRPLVRLGKVCWNCKKNEYLKEYK